MDLTAIMDLVRLEFPHPSDPKLVGPFFSLTQKGSSWVCKLDQSIARSCEAARAVSIAFVKAKIRLLVRA